MRTRTKLLPHARLCARPDAANRPRRFIAEGTSAVSPDWPAWVMSEQLPYLGGLWKSTRPSSSARTGGHASPRRRLCRPARRRGEGRRTRPGPRLCSGSAGAAACGKQRSRRADSAGESGAACAGQAVQSRPARRHTPLRVVEHSMSASGSTQCDARDTMRRSGVSCHVPSSAQAARAPGHRSRPPVL